MIRRVLEIGRWHVEFFFAPDEYDVDAILDRLYDFGAGGRVMRRALDLMDSRRKNRGFTFCNPYERTALVMIGPTTSGRQFQNTLSHEVRHLANGIASSLGIPLDSEEPSYATGDAVMELADVVCRLGCEHCRSDNPI